MVNVISYEGEPMGEPIYKHECTCGCGFEFSEDYVRSYMYSTTEPLKITWDFICPMCEKDIRKCFSSGKRHYIKPIRYD